MFCLLLEPAPVFHTASPQHTVPRPAKSELVICVVKLGMQRACGSVWLCLTLCGIVWHCV